MNSLFIDVGKVFRKEKMTHERRFNEVAKILESSMKKDPHLAEIHTHLESLMVTIVERTKEDSE